MQMEIPTYYTRDTASYFSYAIGMGAHKDPDNWLREIRVHFAFM